MLDRIKKDMIIGQKEVPDLLIDGIRLDTLDSYEIEVNDKNIDLVISTPVIPLLFKYGIVHHKLQDKLLSIYEPYRSLNGCDGVAQWGFIIKSCSISYELGADLEPCRYYLTFRNYENG